MSVACSLEIAIYRHGKLLGQDTFFTSPIIIGRDQASCDLVLVSGSISRQHARIHFDAEGTVLEDAGSKNGCLVNDRPVRRGAVDANDRISLGDFELRLRRIDAEKTLPGQRLPRPPRALGPDATVGDAPPEPGTAAAGAMSVTLEAKGLADAGGPGTDSRALAPPSAEPSKPAGGRRRRAAAPTTDIERTPSTEAMQTRLYEDGRQPGTADRRPAAVHRRPAAARPPKPSRKPPVAAPAARRDEDDHDELDDASFTPPYSLLDRLLGPHAGIYTESPSPAGQAAVEVLTVRAERILDVALLQRPQAVWTVAKRRASRRASNGGLRRVLLAGADACEVECGAEARGSLQRQHKRLELGRVFTRTRGGHQRAVLRAGDRLRIDDRADSYHVHFVPRPPPPLPALSRMAQLRQAAVPLQAAAAAVGLHLLLALILSLLPHQPEAVPTPEFVVKTADELALEQPEPPPPEPPRPPEPPPPPTPTPPAARALRRPLVRARPTPIAAPSPAPAAPSPAPPKPAGILGLLSKRGASAGLGPAAAVQAVANLVSARAPAASGGYRVSGLLGKLPVTAGISLGGGSGLVTKGGAAALRGGAGALRDSGDRRVTGMVQKMPQAMAVRGQGSLDRGQIERVVAAHTAEIQRCYERELLQDQGLSGKVQLEWIIGPDGSVSGVREAFSSVKSAALVRCMMGAAQRWKFPHPSGGSVVVNYPFILKGTDF